jgi:hypothetical protein
MSYPPKDTNVVETPSRSRILETLQSSLRKLQGQLSMNTLTRYLTPPPSYKTVLLQKHSEGISRTKMLNVAEFLEALDPLLPPMTAEKSEKGVEKHLTALFALGTTSTLEWAKHNPGTIIDRIRHFLLHCVARDSDLDLLVPLSQSDEEHFDRLITAYQWSWLHQIVYGWDKTPRETQLRAFKTFCLFIENPIRQLGLPLSSFLSHIKVFKSIHLLPQGSSLFDGPTGCKIFTLQAIRSRGELKRLEELLRMNDMILDAVVDPLHQRLHAALKRKIEAERRISVPSQISSIQWRYVMIDQPEWNEFQRISCNRHCDFAPLRPCGEMNEDKDDRTRIDDNTKFPNLLELRHELEYNPWT